MAFKKYKVADNAMAKLTLPLQETSTTLTLKDIQNIPEKGEWIGTLVRFGEQGVEKMEKVVVKSRNSNVLTVERGFESTPLQRAKDDFLFLNITAEVIRDMQEAISEINLGSKENTSNKKTSIEENKTSNIFFPTVKAVYDWVISNLTNKADLVGGKVKASQLPTIPDDSGLVHKSGDEEIGGNKRFTNDISIGGTVRATSLNTKQDGETNWLNFWKEGELNRIDSYNDKNGFQPLAIRASQLTVNDQDWTGEWQNYTPTLSGDSGGGATFSDQQGRYKVIGKTCLILVRGIIGNKGNCNGKFKVSAPVVCKSRTATPLSGALQFLGQNIAQPRGIPFVVQNHIGINGSGWGHRDIQWNEISVGDFFIFSGIYEIA